MGVREEGNGGKGGEGEVFSQKVPLLPWPHPWLSLKL